MSDSDKWNDEETWHRKTNEQRKAHVSTLIASACEGPPKIQHCRIKNCRIQSPSNRDAKDKGDPQLKHPDTEPPNTWPQEGMKVPTRQPPQRSVQTPDKHPRVQKYKKTKTRLRKGKQKPRNGNKSKHKRTTNKTGTLSPPWIAEIKLQNPEV